RTAVARAARHRVRRRRRGGLTLLHARAVDHGAGDRRRRRRASRDHPPPASTRTVVRLFLFDVDGTLISAGGMGTVALRRALAEVSGTVGAIDRYDFRGKTDPRIVLALLGAEGWGEADIHARLTACFAAYLRELETLIADGRQVRVMPGVAQLVAALSARADA